MTKRIHVHRWVLVLVFVGAWLLWAVALAGPEQDRQAFVEYFQQRFPQVPMSEFANGVYAIDEDARAQWREIEEFPPYEFALEEGENTWNRGFGGGASYSACFEGDPAEIRPQYPQFNPDLGQVETLETALNRCRLEHGAEELAYDSEELIALTAYLAYIARGRPLQISIPESEPRAEAAYEAGKQFYYSKRGQLNISCYDCHVVSAGQFVRADRLSPSLGHPTHFPVYRSKLGRVISLHERFYGCVRDVRAKPFELQSHEFRNLEYFLSYMSNGLEVNGPGARK